MNASTAWPRTRIDRMLGTTAWTVIVAGTVMGAVLPALGLVPAEDLLAWIIPAFFTIVIIRLALGMLAARGRRAPWIALTLALILWATGSATLNTTANGAHDFPSASEVFFLASYVTMGAALVLDVRARRTTAWTAWVEALIVCGAAGTLAAAVIVTPISGAFPQGGLPLLVALLFPLIDLGLALLVVGQWALGARPWSARTAGLIGAFALFAIADASLVLNLSTGTYEFRSALVVLWAVAVQALVSAFCLPNPPSRSVGRSLPAGFLMGSFLLSVIVLIVHPASTGGLLLAIPAAVTCLGTALRLAMALHEARASSQELRLARTDDLTGLPNRPALMNELDRRIRDGQSVGFMLLDLDGFKEVNDTLGHDAGDALIQLAARRITDSVPDNLHVARVGGDEFAILTVEDDALDLFDRAQEIRTAVSAPARVDGLNLRMAGSIGITTSLPDDQRAADVLRRADIAMYDAKSSGTGAVLYQPELDAFSRQRLEMSEELRDGMERGQIAVWYQPKVDARTLDIIGVEALVRWAHPDNGMVSPLAFLPTARRAGLMFALSEVVARQAIAEVAAWHLAGLRIGVAINVAPPELLGGALMPLIYDVMAKHALPPAAVTIEVTEDSFIGEPNLARDVIADVRDHGLHASIDDYGTGFSSLSYLRDLPVNEVKLDRSFVASVHADEPSRLIVSSTVDMSHALGMSVVAEGVEGDSVMASVAAMGVDTLQGYGIAAPMPGAQIPMWVNEWQRRPAPLGRR